MDNIRPFQIGLLVVFAVAGLISVALLASYQGLSSSLSNPYGNRVVIWGTFDREVFNLPFQEISKNDDNFHVVEYRQMDARTFESELVNAIAEGRGPDAIVLSHEDLVSLRSKIQPIAYSTFPERALKDNYIDGAEIFARADGLYAIPLVVDPLLMYWNRDILAASGLSLPPTTWENLTNITQQLTLRDATRNISQATVAFGEYDNVSNAKATLLALLLQSGSRLVEEDNNKYVVAVNQTQGDAARHPLTSTLQFYVEFSNAISPLYSWNRTFQSDLTTFLGGKLALYFGYGSESKRIREQNPNLNFDITGIPQGAGATIKRTYGKFYGLAILKTSSNQAGTYRALARIASGNSTTIISKNLGMAPMQRSLIAAGDSDATRQVIFREALIARGWLDPGPMKSSEIFAQMINEITSGRSKIAASVTDTIRRLELAF